MRIYKSMLASAPTRLAEQERFARVVVRAVVEPSRDIEGLSPDWDASRRGTMSEVGRQAPW